MERIETVANEFLKAYSSGVKDEIKRTSNLFLKEINRDEWQLRSVEHTYLVAKALFYLRLQTELDLYDKDDYTILRLMYYCALKVCIDNKEIEKSDPKYMDFLGCCQLGFILICKEGEYILYSVLPGIGLLPNYANKYLRDQLYLFGGIVKDSYENHLMYMNDAIIQNLFINMSKEIYKYLPVGDDLSNLKNNSFSPIKTIKENLENEFKFDDRFY